MAASLVVLPEAEKDIAQAQSWYERQRKGLGNQLIEALDKTFSVIRDTPEIHAAEYKSVRRVMLKRFPYIVYYRILQHSVEIIAVLHGSRDDQLWQSRA